MQAAEAALDAAQANVDVLKAQQEEALRTLQAVPDGAGQGGARSVLHRDPRALRRRRSATAPCRVGDYVQPGAAAREPGAARRRLHRRQLQGDAARRAAARASRSRSRSTPTRTTTIEGTRRERGAGLGLGVLAAAARQRHRQLHQDRAAPAGAHRRCRPTVAEQGCCGPACRWSSASTPSPARRQRAAHGGAPRDAERR